jgi:hypothetical protein
MNRTIAGLLLLAFASLTTLAHPRAQAPSDPWYGLQSNPRNLDEPKVFTGAFQIQLPKNWHLAPGYTGTIFSIVEDTKKWQTGGVITLEYQRLLAPLEPAMMATAGERFLKDVQDRELSGKQFMVAVKTGVLGPLALIQYDRPGISGSDDHVAQYLIPIGLVLYRLVCVAPTASIDKYKPMFAHVAASFQPAKAPRGK